MRKLNKYKTNIKVILVVFCAMFVGLMTYLGYSVVTYGEKWFATPYNTRLTNAAGIVKAGSIYDRDGYVLANTDGNKREYAANRNVRRAVSHIVGDNKGKSIGAETTFAKYLLGFEKSIGDRVTGALSGDNKRGSDITLSIDAKLSAYIYELLGKNKGAVAVINYKTGEITALVNSPNFDPYKLSNDEIEDTSLVNRATMGKYAPGSTFKIITASCAVENGINFEYECTGETIINGQKITCSGSKHGKLDLKGAFADSCNTYFANLAVKLGSSALKNTAAQFGFNTEFNFSDIVLYSSGFETSSDNGNLAWAGVGLYNDYVTPLHSAMISGGIANGGLMMEPKLLIKLDEDDVLDSTAYKKITNAATAEKISEYMSEVVKSGTGKSAAVKGADIRGKTGTADYISDGKTKSIAWFTGFICGDDEHTYALSIVLEDARSGGKSAAPIASKIFKELIS